MATFKFPVRIDFASYQMRVQLDGTFYDLLLRYNTRSGAWYLDIGRDGTYSLTGVRVVHSADLLKQFIFKDVESELPIGTISIVDVTGADRDPDNATFGTDVQMLYEEAA